MHEPSTLSSNSGSVLLDFVTGRAVGLHFAGRHEGRNYAVDAATIRQRLQDLGVEIE